MTLSLRQLSPVERERAFKHGEKLYLDTIREMEGGVAYAISCNGVSARALKIRLNKAATTLGLSLRWAPCDHNAAECVVELDCPEGDN